MDLNDPFECKPIVKYKNPGKYIDLYIKGRLKIIPDLLMEQNTNLSRSEARKIAKSAAKKIKQDFMRNIEANLALGLEDIMRNINKRIGILSLTEDLKNRIQQATQTWPNANDVKIKRITIGASGLEYA